MRLYDINNEARAAMDLNVTIPDSLELSQTQVQIGDTPPTTLHNAFYRLCPNPSEDSVVALFAIISDLLVQGKSYEFGVDNRIKLIKWGVTPTP